MHLPSRWNLFFNISRRLSFNWVKYSSSFCVLSLYPQRQNLAHAWKKTPDISVPPSFMLSYIHERQSVKHTNLGFPLIYEKCPSKYFQLPHIADRIWMESNYRSSRPLHTLCSNRTHIDGRKPFFFHNSLTGFDNCPLLT